MMLCTRLYVDPIESVIGQAIKKSESLLILLTLLRKHSTFITTSVLRKYACYQWILRPLVGGGKTFFGMIMFLKNYLKSSSVI